MIETHFRKTYQQLCINPLLNLGFLQKVHPHVFTCIACLLGISMIPLLSFGFSFWACVMLGISGFFDTLDGSLARHLKIASPQGAALDIICDRITEFAIIFGLYTVEPNVRALPTILMLGSILICITSFLIVGVFTEKSSEKSFFYSPGLIERAEAFIAFAIMILFPSTFAVSSYIFSFLVLLTAALRMHQFFRESAFLIKRGE
ncbi:MAG: CDP-alcohol phosphatidyltransferase family protein [Simkaniaceae bacterium]|nr:CDP-alcohol phosphatidyltransferase family protein [Simkaniaceae bacterium]